MKQVVLIFHLTLIKIAAKNWSSCVSLVLYVSNDKFNHTFCHLLIVSNSSKKNPYSEHWTAILQGICWDVPNFKQYWIPRDAKVIIRSFSIVFTGQPIILINFEKRRSQKLLFLLLFYLTLHYSNTISCC